MNSKQILLREDVVQKLGEALKAAREGAHESIDTIADRLLISKRQVVALETGQVKAFYSPRFFVQLIRKYCAHLKIDCPDNLIAEGTLLAGEITAPIAAAQMAPAPAPTVATPTPPATEIQADAAPEASATKPKKSTNASSMRLGAMIGLIALAGGAWMMRQGTEPNKDVISPAASTATPAAENHTSPAADPAKLTEQPAATKESSTQPQPTPAPKAQQDAAKLAIQLETNRVCWIQLNYTDGRKVQKIYPAKTQLEFKQGELTGIIVGDLNAASLVIDGKAIALSQYQKPDSNVARLLGKDAELTLGK